MAYQTHNFSSGDTLYASQLNEMDAQIAQNEQTANRAVKTVNGAAPDADGNVVVSGGGGSDGGGNSTLADMRVIRQVTIEEATDSMYVDLGKNCKACRFVFRFPSVISENGYVYVAIAERSDSVYNNMSGANVSNALILEYIRIAADYRPISVFAVSGSEGNERTSTLLFGVPRQDRVTVDEKNGIRYLHFSTYQISFPVGTVITILGA